MPIKTIQKLNDTFRQTGQGGKIVLTCGVDELPVEDKEEILGLVKSFSAFNNSNDLYGEHDFGLVEQKTNCIFWKIDYYSDESLESKSEDASDPGQTFRLLTIMMHDEY